MFNVLLIRNKATLSSHMCFFKDLAYYVWRENFKNIFFDFQKKKILFWISEKKNVKLEKPVLIRKIVLFLDFRKPY